MIFASDDVIGNPGEVFSPKVGEIGIFWHHLILKNEFHDVEFCVHFINRSFQNTFQDRSFQ